MTKLAILIPHKRAPANDRALSVALDCIIANTGVDYEVLIDSETPACPYQVIHQLAEQTQAEYLVFSNSDIFFAPGWAEPMLAMAQPDRIVTGVLVEPGVIPVSSQNVQRDHGILPHTFRRTEFEYWVTHSPTYPLGDGWYFPAMHHRETFLTTGGFDTSRGVFPEPLDKYYWEAWRASGREIRRVPSYAYHLQAFAERSETGRQGY